MSMMNKLFVEMSNEERKVVYDETYKDIAGCCYPWEEPFEAMDGICPDCGRATTNGKCVCGCCYSGCACETCGACPCDMSC